MIIEQRFHVITAEQEDRNMEGISIFFILIGAGALTMRLMKIIDWFEPTSYTNTHRRTRRAEH